MKMLAPIAGLLVFPFFAATGQVWESFEAETVPESWAASNDAEIRTTTNRSLHGERSLEWVWSSPEADVVYSGPVGYQAQGYQVFSFWIYLESPLPASALRFDFEVDGSPVTGFEFGLNFTGWRTAFVPFNDMDGTASTAMNGLRIRLAGDDPARTGKLLLEQVVFAKVMDTRHQYEDLQVPFVRAGRVKTHWEPRVSEWGRDPRETFQPGPDEIGGAADLVAAWHEFLLPVQSVTENTMQQLGLEIEAFGLRVTDEGVRGNHVFFRNYPPLAYPPDLREAVEATGKAHDFRRFGTLQLNLARAYHNTTNAAFREQLAEWFRWSAAHLLDQGWAAGSSQGTIHHFGYQAREYFVANFLMREILAKNGLLVPTREAMQWYFRAGQLLEDFVEPNIDYYNTNSQGQLLALLMEADPELRASWVMAYSENLSTTLATVTPGDGLGLKPDGTAFHHNGHYPAYSFSAFASLGRIFDQLRGTPFQPRPEAHRAFRRAVLAQRIYSQTFDWPIALSGRHPFNFDFRSTRNAFAALAAYPHPDTGVRPDPEVSAAYLRLWGNPPGELGGLIRDAGIVAEELDGMWSFPFANHAVVRRDNWMASLKGFSKYVWSSEIYSADNRYGRYQSNGPIEILYEGGRSASGYRESGWDWNRLPGATGVHLPLEELDSPLSGTLMRRSDETFAGAAVRDGADGIFGVILNEDYFGNGLQARKSVTAIGDLLIALGSKLRSTNAEFPLETALFQNALTHPGTPHFVNDADNPVTGFDAEGSLSVSDGAWLLDAVGTGYWLSPGSNLKWHRKVQESRHNKTRAATFGPFATAWLDHGKAPADASYHFIVRPNATSAEMEELTSAMGSTATAPYRVIRQTREIHAIRSHTDGAYYISAFEPVASTGVPFIHSIGTPSLLVARAGDDAVHLSVANPDLNPSSRGHPAAPSELVVNGQWEPVENPDVLFWHVAGKTTLLVPTRMGMTFDLLLEPAGEKRNPQDLPSNDAVSPPETRQEDPASLRLNWSMPDAGETHGWIVERLTPESGEFVVVQILNGDQSDWVDAGLEVGRLAAYRIRRWSDDGISPPGNPVPLFLGSGTQLAYFFPEMDSVDRLWSDGWTHFGINDYATDFYLTSDGLMMMDNDPVLPAGITLPLEPSSVGSVSAELGVFSISNYFVNLSVSGGGERLAAVQLTTRTEGFIEGSERTDFTDASWDIRHGPPRLVRISWVPVDDDTLRLTAQFYGSTAEADVAWTDSIPQSSAPVSVTLQLGFGTAVNRGAWIRSLQVATGAPSASVPWEAFSPCNPTPWSLRLHGDQALVLSWLAGADPHEYGLKPIFERSDDLVSWSSAAIEHEDPLTLTLGEPNRPSFFRVRLHNPDLRSD